MLSFEAWSRWKERTKEGQWPTELFKDWRHLWGCMFIDQAMRTWNFRAWNEIVERVATSRSEKGKKANVERKVGECFQWKAIGQCSERDSCSFRHDQTSGDRCVDYKGRQDNRPLPHQVRRHRPTVRHPQRVRAAEEKALWKEGDSHADIEKNVRIRHVIVGTLPCVKITGLKQDAKKAQIAISDIMRRRRSPARSRRKEVRKDQLLCWRRQFSWVVYLKIPIRSFLFYGKRDNWEQDRP